MEIENFSEILLIEILDTLLITQDKQVIQKSLVQIHQALKIRMEFFNPRGPYHNLVLRIIDVINKFFTTYEKSFEFYKGLIFLSNICLYLDKSYSEHFLMQNPCLLTQLSNCFLFHQKSEKTEADFMNEYQLLALIAQLLHQTNKSEIEDIKNIRESIIQKKFLTTILTYDLHDLSIPQKRIQEAAKIMSLLLLFIVRRKYNIENFKLMPKTKTFILKQISLITDFKILCNFFSCLHYISESNLKFTENELIKYKIIEKIDTCLQQKEILNLIWYSGRMLRIFMKYPRIRAKIFQMQLVEKMIKVFAHYPRGVCQFVEEVVEMDEIQSTQFLTQRNLFFENWIIDSLNDNIIKKDEVKYLFKIIAKLLQFHSTMNILELIGQGLLEKIWIHFDKGELKVKELIIQLFKIVLEKTKGVKINGNTLVVKQHMEVFEFGKVLRKIREQYLPFKIHQLVVDILENYYQISENQIII